MSSRQVFSESEKTCLKELVVQYKLHKTSSLTVASQSLKRLSWRRLTEDFNSIETNAKRTEAQLKKCYDNLKTRQKNSFIKKAWCRRRIRSDQEPCTLNGLASTDPLKTEPVCDDTNGENRSVVDYETINVSEDTDTRIIKEEVVEKIAEPPKPLDTDTPSQRVSPLREATLSSGSRSPEESINVGSKVIEEEFSLKQIAHAKKERREDELHKMIMKEKEWMVMAAEETYYKAKADRAAAEEFVRYRRAERKLAEYELRNKSKNDEI